MTIPAGPLFTPEEVRRSEELEADLVEALCSREAIAFVGAGSSHSSGYPLWFDLLAKLAEAATEVNQGFLDNPADPPHRRAQAIWECINTAKGAHYWRGKITQIFADTNEPVPFHLDLVDLPFRAFLTTNYDLLLERAIGQLRKIRGESLPAPIAAPVHQADALVLSRAIRQMVDRKPVQHVIHLHGCVGHPASYILASSEYVEAYGFDPWIAGDPPSLGRHPLLSLLLALMMTRRLVFVGYSHDDLYVREVLAQVTDTNWEWAETIHFAILPIDPANPDRDKLLARYLAERMGVATLFYEAPKQDHSGRDRLIRRISERVRLRCGATTPKAAPPEPATRTPPPQWVASTNARAKARKVSIED